MPPLVSVVVPSFNVEGCIAETLESVRTQTVADWEAVVADDGSTDATVAVARAVAATDPRVRVLEHRPTRHPGATRNRGLAAARGEYVAFLDADDLWLPRKLELQLAAMRRVERPGLCYTRSEAFDDGPAPYRRAFRDDPPAPTREAQYERLLVRGDNCNTSSFLLERAFLEEIGPFSESSRLRSGQDTDFLLRAAWRRPMIYVPEILSRVRNRAASLTASNVGNWERYFAIFEAAEARGELPRRLRGKCFSKAWLVKAERLLRDGSPGWRGAFLRALALDPTNPRRWPGAAAALAPRPAMAALHEGLKRLADRG